MNANCKREGNEVCSRKREMALSAASATVHKWQGGEILCSSNTNSRKKERENWAYKVVEISPPPKSLGVRSFPPNLQCGESITIEGQTYTISAVTHRYRLRKGKYEPRDKRLDVLSTGRHILNLYLHNLLDQS
ncbi:hypothetical protein V2J09_020519 [Rumex salicifolius]